MSIFKFCADGGAHDPVQSYKGQDRMFRSQFNIVEIERMLYHGRK